MKKILLFLSLIVETFFCYSQVDVHLKTHKQTVDSLIVSVSYFNKSSNRIILDGFSGVSYENYIPVLRQVYKANNDFSMIRPKEGNVLDTIRLFLPETKEIFRYQKLKNGDSLDVFDVYSSFYNELPKLTGNDSIDFSFDFLDKHVFYLLWTNKAWSNDIFFNDNFPIYYYWPLITINPHSNREILIDMSYLLKRKATYILQVYRELIKDKTSSDVKRIMKKKFGYKPYNKPLKSNSIIIVSN